MESRILGLETDIKKILKATGGCEQQLKDMNGTIIDLKKKDLTHDETFKEVYDEFKNINEFKNQMKGGLYLLSIIITVFIALVGFKVFLI